MLTYGSTTLTANINQMDGTEEWDYIRCHPTGSADMELYLPAISSSNVGRRYLIRHVGSSLVVILWAAGNDTIEGTTDLPISHGHQMTIQSIAFGSGWRWDIIAR